MLAKLEELDIANETIVVVAGDNGRDTSFHGPNNRSSQGNFRGGYFSTYEGNNRTIGLVRWPGHIEPRTSDEMMHVVDWFPTILGMIGHGELIPSDRVIDGIDQTAFVTGDRDESDRDHFHMFFDKTHVGMRWKNFKVFTHQVESGASPVVELAIPHIMNLTVNPDEDTPYNYEDAHSWVLYRVFMPMTAELQASLARDSVPFGAPLDYVPPGLS